MLLCFSFVFLCICGALDITAAQHDTSTAALIPRQDQWWPYGPYSQWGSPGAPTLTASPSPTLPATSTNAVSSAPTAVASSVPALDAASTTLLTAPDPSTTQQSTTSTASTITITALPPATTPARRYRRSSSSGFDIAYLSPIFALAGAVVGALLAWLVIRTLRRHKGLWEPRLKAGPPYAPTQTQETESSSGDAASQTTSEAFLSRGRVSRRRSTHGSVLSRAASKKSSNWLVRALSSHRREAAADSDAEMGNQSGIAAYEDDPFLVPPSVDRPARGASLAGVRDASPSRFELLRTPDVLSEDEELDNTPWDTLRHKSIRRGILERLQEGPQHRKGHQRNDSDVTVEQAQFLSVPPLNIRSPARGRSLTRVRSDETDTSAPGSSGPGFRIVDEDPESDTRSSIFGIDVRFPWRSPSALSRSRVPDNLTALPVRTDSAGRRRSPAAASRIVELLNSPTPETPSPTGRLPLARDHSGVLPSSPPRIASPPLEAGLFFAPLASFGSAPRLELGFETSKGRMSERAGPRATTGPPTRVERHHNTLHTTRAPPALPFPSSPQYTCTPKRLTKKPLRSDSAQSKKLASPPAMLEVERKHGALDKVEQILAQSYSIKDFRGEERGSPTMFGAAV